MMLLSWRLSFTEHDASDVLSAMASSSLARNVFQI